MREIVPRPLSVPPLDGAKFLFSIANISVITGDIATFLSALFTYLGSLYSAPGTGGLGPKIWGSGPPNQKFMSGDPEIFWLDKIFSKFADRQRVGTPFV